MYRQWDKSRPPPGAFVLNKDSERAQGLVAWYPMGGGAGAEYDHLGTNHFADTGTSRTVGNANEPAVSFNGSTSVLQSAVVPVYAAPLSVSAWVRKPVVADTTTYALSAFGDYTLGSGGGARRFQFDTYNGDLRWVAVGAATGLATKTGIVANRWQHLMGIEVSTASRYAAIDGVLGTQDTTSATPGGTQNRFVLGAIFDGGSNVGFLSGELGEFCVWNNSQLANVGALADPGRRFELWYPLRSRKWISIAAAAGIAFDAASNSGYQAAASSYSWNHTCTGSNRYLTVGISMLSLAQTVTSITYNGVAMTLLGNQNSVSGAARVEMWGLIAPDTGTNLIAVTLSGAIASAGNASSYTGVNQTSPIEAWNSAQATNVGAADATVNVTTVADNDWCVDIVATDDAVITVGAGQTQAGNVTGAGGSGAMSYEGPKTPAGSVTMSWANVGTLATWSIGSIALRPVAASGLGGFLARWWYELVGRP